MKKNIVSFIGRAGYSSRALIYLVMGTLAFLSIFPSSYFKGERTDSKGVISSISNIPFSDLLLTLLIIGLICYSLWRIIQSLGDADDHGKDIKGLATRVSLLISAITHLSLAYFTYKVLTLQNTQSSSKSEYASDILSYEYGAYILAGLGLLITFFGVTQIIKAYKRGYTKYMSFKGNKWMHTTSRLGLVTRGLVFGMIGSLVVYAAYTTNTSRAGNISKIWKVLSDLPFGSLIVASMATGLILFGLYSALEAIYREVSHK